VACVIQLRVGGIPDCEKATYRDCYKCFHRSSFIELDS
jgi:hypothetical protein